MKKKYKKGFLGELKESARETFGSRKDKKPLRLRKLKGVSGLGQSAFGSIGSFKYEGDMNAKVRRKKKK